LLDDGRPVAGFLYFVEDVARHQNRFAPLLFLLDETDEALLHQRIEAARRLVEDQNVRVGHEGHHDPDFLLHPLWKTFDARVGDIELKKFEQFLRPVEVFDSIDIGHPGNHFTTLDFLGEGDFAREIAQAGIRDLARAPDPLTMDSNFPLLRSDKAKDLADGRGFSSPIGAEKTEDLAFVHRKGNIENPPLIPVVFANMFNLNNAHKNTSWHSQE